MRLWERMLTLESKENEPGRLKNRGGQLLKEERERKMIATKLPKIKDEITELVEVYEAENRQFLVHGESLIEKISNDYLRRREVKDQQMSARKANQANNTYTPIQQRSIMVRTPMSGVPSVKRVASSCNM